MHFFDNVARRGNGVFVCFRIKTNTSAVHLATSLLIRIEVGIGFRYFFRLFSKVGRFSVFQNIAISVRLFFIYLFVNLHVGKVYKGLECIEV